jgi:hypothetical protein
MANFLEDDIEIPGTGWEIPTLAALLAAGAGYVWLANRPNSTLSLPDFLRFGDQTGVGRRGGIRVYGPGHDTVTTPYYRSLPQPKVRSRNWGDSGALAPLNPGYSSDEDLTSDSGELAWDSPVSGVRGGAGRYSLSTGTGLPGGGRYSVMPDHQEQTPGRRLSDSELDAGLPMLF